MRHSLLDGHSKIAWDMDQTLIKGPNSEYFREYIAFNPHKKHHIVTFRDSSWAEDCLYELAPYGIRKSMIAGVHACPQHYYHAFEGWAYQQRQKSRKLIFPGEEIDVLEDMPEDAKNYVHWKGKMASELGCTVLVDDMPELVLPGCKLYGIAFVDSLSPHIKLG